MENLGIKNWRGENIPYSFYIKKTNINHLSYFFLVFLENVNVVKTIRVFFFFFYHQGFFVCLFFVFFGHATRLAGS